MPVFIKCALTFLSVKQPKTVILLFRISCKLSHVIWRWLPPTLSWESGRLPQCEQGHLRRAQKTYRQEAGAYASADIELGIGGVDLEGFA